MLPRFRPAQFHAYGEATHHDSSPRKEGSMNVRTLRWVMVVLVGGRSIGRRLDGLLTQEIETLLTLAELQPRQSCQVPEVVMRLSRTRLSSMFLALVLASCESSTQAPTAPRPSFSSVAPASCPAHATFIATDAPSLVSAVAAAQPNDTIAVRGTVTDPGIFIFTDGLTFTCAVPGSGLRADPQTT